jgi:type I restriction enzyme M protein
MPIVTPRQQAREQIDRQANLDIFWLRDESFEETANLPEPDVLAEEVVADLESALEQFRAIAEDLGEGI